MRRIAAVLGSAIFLVIAPGIVAGYVPWRICRWQVGGPLLGTSLFRFFGLLLIAAGLPILLDSFARFALQGLGTPAPVFPTHHLVVSGLFRYVRNPTYVAVVSLILGQGLFFGSVRVLEYGIAVWAAFHLFVLIYEEPTLRKTYGPEYKQFCAMSQGGFRVCALGGVTGNKTESVCGVRGSRANRDIEPALLRGSFSFQNPPRGEGTQRIEFSASTLQAQHLPQRLDFGMPDLPFPNSSPLSPTVHGFRHATRRSARPHARNAQVSKHDRIVLA